MRAEHQIFLRRLAVGTPPLFVLLASLCEPTIAWGQSDGTWIGHPPFTRVEGAAVYDPVRRRMLHFGGSDVLPHGDVWAYALDGPPAWTKLEPMGTPPLARHGHSVVYDPLGDRVILFGGEFSIFDDPLGDVWALDLAGDPTWTQLTPSGAGPSGRLDHRAIYDPAAHRMIVIGGYDGQGALADVWSLGLSGAPEWMPLDPQGPPFPARYGHGAVLDSARQRVVVFGGYGGFGVGHRNDAWTLTLDEALTWTPIATSGPIPSPRSGHLTQLDVEHDRLVVFGGYDGSAFLNDLWVLSLSGSPQWSAISLPGCAPPARHGSASILDPIENAIVLFGGYREFDALGDTWVLDLSPASCWDERTPTPPGPPRRSAHAAVYDPERRVLWMYGARYGESGVWKLPLDGPLHWSPVATAGIDPPVRGGHTAVYDSARDRIVVFGGNSAAGALADLWFLDLSSSPPRWLEVAPSGTPPPPRFSHSAVLDGPRSRMLVVGGADASGTPLGDVWALSLDGTPTWSELQPGGGLFPPRAGHVAVWDAVSDRMLVHGGSGGGIRNDLWELSFATAPAWTEIQTAGDEPGPRVDHTLTPDPSRHRWILFGGADGQHLHNDTWELSLMGEAHWQLLIPAGGLPASRAEHVAISDPIGDRLVVHAGFTAVGFPINIDDTWTLQFSELVASPPPAQTPDPCPFGLTALPPHPARGIVRLQFTLPAAAHVRLAVYDVTGRLRRVLVDRHFDPGVHDASWNARTDGVRAGVYLCELVVGGERATARLVVLD